MLKKITVSKNLSYSKSVDYSEQKPYHERLKEAGAIDLRNNSIFVDMHNGYGRLIPVDENKKFR